MTPVRFVGGPWDGRIASVDASNSVFNVMADSDATAFVRMTPPGINEKPDIHRYEKFDNETFLYRGTER